MFSLNSHFYLQLFTLPYFRLIAYNYLQLLIYTVLFMLLYELDKIVKYGECRNYYEIF